MRFLLAAIVAASITQQQPPPKLPTLPPVTPASNKPVQAPYEFTTDIGAFLVVVKADKTGPFEAAIAKLKTAFALSTASADRKRQASGWRVLKSSETATPSTPAVAAVAATATTPAVAAVPAGPAQVTYLFLIEPVSKKASYNMIEIMTELMPGEVQTVYDQLKDAILSTTRIGLTELLKMGAGS